MPYAFSVMGLTGGVWCVMHFTPGGIVSVSLFFYVKSLNLGQADDRDGRVQRHLPVDAGIDPDDSRGQETKIRPISPSIPIPPCPPPSHSPKFRTFTEVSSASRVKSCHMHFRTWV